MRPPPIKACSDAPSANFFLYTLPSKTATDFFCQCLPENLPPKINPSSITCNFEDLGYTSHIQASFDNYCQETNAHHAALKANSSQYQEAINAF